MGSPQGQLIGLPEPPRRIAIPAQDRRQGELLRVVHHGWERRHPQRQGPERSDNEAEPMISWRFLCHDAGGGYQLQASGAAPVLHSPAGNEDQGGGNCPWQTWTAFETPRNSTPTCRSRPRASSSRGPATTTGGSR